MKKFLLLLVSVITLTFSFTSCSKDDDNSPENSYSYGDKKVSNTSYAAYDYFTHEKGNGYYFVIAPNKTSYENAEDLLFLSIPEELLGQKVELSKEYSYFFTTFIAFRIQDTWGESTNKDNSNNWMKVTKNSDDNFIIEVQAEINNKILKAYYKGKFTKDEIRP